MTRALAAVVSLGRPSNLATVWSGVFAGLLLGCGAVEGPIFAALATALSLAYCGGMALNDAFDALEDARARPWRPIPSGALARSAAFGVGVAALAAAVAVLVLFGWQKALAGGWAAGPLGLILIGLIVVYDAGHDRPSAPILMGLCRAFVYLLPAVCVSGRLEAACVVAAVQLAAFAAGVSCAAGREDGADRLWPLALMAFPLLFSASSLAARPAALPFWLAAAAWTGLSMRRLICGERRVAVPRLIAAISLFDALFIASAGGSLAASAAAAAGFPLTLALQRVNAPSHARGPRPLYWKPGGESHA